MRKLKILITNNALDRYAGTETFVYTIAKELHRRGHMVFCYSPVLGEVAKRLKEANIIVSKEFNFHPDIIHGHHCQPTTDAYKHFKVPTIFVKHGWVYEQEDIPKIPIKKLFVVSEELQKMVGGTILRNPIDMEIFKREQVGHNNQNPTLFLSNHPVKFDMAGIEYVNQEWNMQDDINYSDVVISSGRGALEAMACNRPTIIFGRFGADGLVTKDNFNQLKKYNFSGRCLGMRWTKELLEQEIKLANRLKPRLRELVKKEFDSIKIVDQLEQEYERTLGYNNN